MGYRLGVDIGTTFTAAAVRRDGRTEMLGLGNRAMQVPSVLFLKEDGQFLVGEAAETRAAAQPERVAREFKRRLGDPVPILVAGRPFSAEALTAKLLSWVVAMATERQGEAPEAVVVARPASWGDLKTHLLHHAVQLADIPDVLTCTEPEAAAISYASRQPLGDGRVVAVYDLGGGTFDAAVLRSAPTGFEILGTPEGIEHLGGVDFDEAVFRHVLSAADMSGVDPEDPQVMWALQRLRRDCVAAKEALSLDTEALVPVAVAGRHETVRLTRGELEELLRPAIDATVGTMRRVLRSAEVDPDDVSAFVLVGGSSRIPLVSEVLTGAFGRPLAVDTHPKHDIARGAALYAEQGIDARGALSAPPGTRPPSSDTAGASQSRTEPAPPPARQTSRRPAALAAAGIVLAVLAAIAVLVWPGIGTESKGGAQQAKVTKSSPPPTHSRSASPTSSAALPAGDVPRGARLPTSTILWLRNNSQVWEYTTRTATGKPLLPEVDAASISMSKDRRTLAYIGAADGLIHLTGSDGRHDRLVLRHKPPGCPFIGRPAFAVNDTELVVACNTCDPKTCRDTNASLHVVHLDGTFVPEPLVTGFLGDPTVNRNSTLVAYWYTADTKLPTQIWTVPLTGGRSRQVTQDPIADNDPAFSPIDDNTLAYRRGPTGGQADIATISVTGGSPDVFREIGDQQDPSWSPDGTQIACKTGPSGNANIGIVTLQGKRFHTLLDDDVPDTTPAWTAR